MQAPGKPQSSTPPGTIESWDGLPVATAEQPFDFMLVETDRAYRPSKTMRRMIVAAWGPDANLYTGRRLYEKWPITREGRAVSDLNALMGVTR